MVFNGKKFRKIFSKLLHMRKIGISERGKKRGMEEKLSLKNEESLTFHTP
jgi:hypothetical protein